MMWLTARRAMGLLTVVPLLGACSSWYSTVGPELAAKQAEMRRLAPADTGTDPVTEGRIRDLLLSVEPDQLAVYKFDLEYDGDGKDMVEYVFHDVDRSGVQRAIVDHLKKAPPHDGIKVLSDVDDTIFGNLIDQRYPRLPKRTLYPGVLTFYNAMKYEPHRPDAGTFVHDGIAQVPITTLSARPNPIVGHLEKRSIASLIDLTRPTSSGPLALQLRPSALSGHATSSAVGTLETVFRNRLTLGLSFLGAPPKTALSPGEEPVDLLTDFLPNGQEDKIAEVKFMNFLSFASVYPEYRFVFVGDSGQADALTAQRILESGAVDGGPRVITTFIHDLKDRRNQTRTASPAFDRLAPTLRVDRASSNGRGVIVFRNYIDAAVIAFVHRTTLMNLITADELVAVTVAALQEFEAAGIDDVALRESLRREYRDDANTAADLLKPPEGTVDPAAEIRRLLSSQLWAERDASTTRSRARQTCGGATTGFGFSWSGSTADTGSASQTVPGPEEPLSGSSARHQGCLRRGCGCG
jgi:hypothetical protein